MLLGHRVVCAVEIAPYAATVLAVRQNDGLLPPFPIWDDIRSFDGRPWRGIVDLVSGGFPCQDISCAGKGAGIDGSRSGLWREFSRIIGEIRPAFAFVENSPMLTVRGLGRVLGDLAALGYDAKWGVLGAADIGAPHQRDRIWIVAANANRQRQHGQGNEQPATGLVGVGTEISHAGGGGCPRDGMCFRFAAKIPRLGDYREFRGWWETEPGVGRVVDVLAARVDRLKALGNGQVPLCAATAWQILANDFQFLRA
jgi:DNA (cytosine-5)-methyltransferase 1